MKDTFDRCMGSAAFGLHGFYRLCLGQKLRPRDVLDLWLPTFEEWEREGKLTPWAPEPLLQTGEAVR